MDEFVNQLTAFATNYGLKIVGAILILIVGRIIASIARSLVRRLLNRRKIDDTVVSFLASMVYTLVMIAVLLAVMQKFGFGITSFVAILGAAAFAVGFALQGSLSNFAAGVMIIVFRPYKIGDFIDAAGVAGVVEDIHLFNTILDTPDNIRVIVPNSKITGDVIKNVTGNDTRRVDMVIGISYDSPIGKAMDLALSVMKADKRILGEPEPMVAVSELADSSVNLVVRPWVNKADYWAVKFDVTHKIKEAFDKGGIEIPFPQHVVHMASEGS